MELNSAIRGRRAVRSYTDQVPDEETIRRVIRAAVNAPSARNGQPWRFTVVRDRAVLERLNAEAKLHHLAHVTPGPGAEERRARMSDPETHLLHHAPALVLISAAVHDRWSTEDCSLAAQNLMLAAYAEGLGSCWIGMVQDYVNTPEGKALLGLPAEFASVAPIILGYPTAWPSPVARNEPVIGWVG